MKHQVIYRSNWAMPMALPDHICYGGLHWTGEPTDRTIVASANRSGFCTHFGCSFVTHST